MAITTSYSFVSLQTLDLTAGPTIGSVSSAPLASGGVAAAGRNAAGQTVLDIFGPDGANAGGGINFLPGIGLPIATSVTQLNNGTFVVAGHDLGLVAMRLADATGNPIGAQVDVESNSFGADVAALTNGGFIVARHRSFSGTDRDIKIDRRDAAGTLLGVTVVDSSGANDTLPAVTGLTGGGFAVVWQRAVAGTVQVWTAVYDQNGGTVRAPSMFDSLADIFQNVDIAAKADGGFAIIYEDDGGLLGRDIMLAEFTAAGAAEGGIRRISNPSSGATDPFDVNPSITLLANGLLAVSYSRLGGGGAINTQLAIFDPVLNVIGGSVTVTAGEPVTDRTAFSTLAGLAGGKIAVFHVNSTDSDADGEVFKGVRTQQGDADNDTMSGDLFNDIMNGGAGTDTGNTGYALGDDFNTSGTAANFTLTGSQGDDQYINTETLVFTDGTTNAAQFMQVDSFVGSKRADTFNGLGGNDTLLGKKGADILNGSGGDDLVNGGKGNDLLKGGGGNDQIIGGKGADSLDGGSGNDSLVGGKGADLLTGGKGIDVMYGGKGKDHFIFSSILDSGVGPGNRDKIDAFEAKGKDIINVSAIDANSATAADDAFTFVGASAFTGAGQIRVSNISGKTLLVEFNTDASLAVNMEIEVTIKKGVFDAADIVL